MKITITKATADDVHAIFLIEQKSFSHPWSEKAILESIVSPSIFTLKAVNDEGLICGYAMIMTVADEAELLNIAVESAHRNCGIGSALMNEVIARADEQRATAIYLEVRDSNDVARSLYRRLGFSMIGIRKNYYKNPTEDAILMKKIPETQQ